MRLLERAHLAATYLGRSSLHLLFPPSCPVCENELESLSEQTQFVCERCFETIIRLTPPWCDQCGDPIESPDLDLCESCAHSEAGFDLCRSYGIYDGVLARLIQLLKYEKERALSRPLSTMLQGLIGAERLAEHFDAITFVPMRPNRKHVRGFNQAELLARSLGKQLSMPVLPALNKIRDTKSQMELSGEARRNNLRDVFATRHQQLPEKILLVDDVFTTGSTLSECAKALKAAGVKHVIGLTVARAPLSDHTEEHDED